MNTISLVISSDDCSNYLLCNFFIDSKTEKDRKFVFGWWDANRRAIGEIVATRLCAGENPKTIFQNVSEQIERSVGFETRFAIADSVCRMLIMIAPPSNGHKQEGTYD